MLFYLDHLVDVDDGRSGTYETDQPISKGDVIIPNDGNHYCVTGVKEGPERVHLVISESAQSPEAAKLLAKQHGHL